MIIFLKIIGTILSLNLLCVGWYYCRIPREMRRNYSYFHAENMTLLLLFGSLILLLLFAGFIKKLHSPEGGKFKWGYLREELVGQNSEYIDLVKSDLKREVRELKANNRNGFFIAAFVVIQSVRTIVPVLVDGLLRLVARVLPFGKIFKS